MSSSLAAPTPEQTKAYFEIFLGDPKNHYVRWSNKEPAYERVEAGITEDDLAHHLNGEEPSLLSIPINHDNKSFFGAIDVDAHDYPEKGIVATPIDHVALARKITQMGLPLVCCRSKSGKGAWLWIFFKEKEGFSAATARRLLKRYVKVLGITNEVDIFPRQDSIKEDGVGNGINLPYFGEERRAFGKDGEDLDLDGFISLAAERAVYGGLLEKRELVGEDPSEVPLGVYKDRPMSVEAIRKIHDANLKEFLDSGKTGGRNNALNKVCFFAGRAFVSKALLGTERDVKEEIRRIAREVKLPMDEFEITAASGWNSGVAQPLKILDSKQEHDEALARVRAYIAGTDTALPSLDALASDLDLLTPGEFLEFRKVIAGRFNIGVGELDTLLKRHCEKQEEEEQERIRAASIAASKDGILVEIGRLSEILQQSERVLAGLTNQYFETNGRLVFPSYARDVEPDKRIKRDDDCVILRAATRELILRDLDKHAYYYELDSKGNACQTRVPPNLPDHVIEHVSSKPAEVLYPRLEIIVSSPALLADGSIHEEPEKLKAGVFFTRPKHNYAKIAISPSREDAICGLRKFEPVFEGFPFEGKTERFYTASYSVVLALSLTLAARSGIPNEAIPLFGSTAPRQREGKTSSLESAVLAARGIKPTVITYAGEEEFGKTLLPVLLEQDCAILVDNIARDFQSMKLSPVLTGGAISDRILGESTRVKLHNRAVFMASGVNLTIAGDMASRTVMCQLDANMDRPESREFNFSPATRARERHPELLAGALTALRAYHVAGRPWDLKRAPWGGFEEWDRLICGCLTWLGFKDPFETREAVLCDDPISAEYAAILRAFFDLFGELSVTVEHIGKNESELRALLVDPRTNTWNPRYAGWKLRRMKGRVEDGLKLIEGEGLGGRTKNYWRVQRLVSPAGQQESFAINPEMAIKPELLTPF
jgi:hypothetical protein